MYFIVSVSEIPRSYIIDITERIPLQTSKEENSKISEHTHRIGYHFRETIVDEAREKLGELAISKPDGTQAIEPIPESQEEINKQADGAIRDLFPRIPHTDRQMIIEHAFKKVKHLPNLLGYD